MFHSLFRNSFHLRTPNDPLNIRDAKRRIAQYDRETFEARKRGNQQEYRERHDHRSGELALELALIEAWDTKRLIDDAKRLRVQGRVEIIGNPENWANHHSPELACLVPKASAQLDTLVAEAERQRRNDQREELKAWGTFIAALTGLAGVIGGVIVQLSRGR